MSYGDQSGGYGPPPKSGGYGSCSGTLIGRDGDREIRTPYSDCVLIMPTRRPRKGETAVRLGRFVD